MNESSETITNDPATVNPFTPKTRERFFAKVNKLGSLPRHKPDIGRCWEWTATRFRQGYGGFRLDGKMQTAHRISYQMHFGFIDESLEVCHECDNPACVNPQHLWQGTHTDNMRDMNTKARRVLAFGSAHGLAKLDDAKVREIKLLLAAGETMEPIAIRFGVCMSSISNIRNGRTWRHVG